MGTRARARWRVYEVQLKTSRYTAHRREVEPDRALNDARWKARLYGPHQPDTVNAPDALARLVAGETLTCQCLNAYVITVEALDL